MKVGIYGQFYHQDSEKYVQLILNILQNHGVDVHIEKEFLKIIEQHEGISTPLSSIATFDELDASYDLFFSIGGDGTLLKSVTFVRDLNIPIVGINTGRLGFLATIQKENIRVSLENIIQGNYSISERTLLSIETFPVNETLTPLHFALNEIAVNRKNTTSMIKVDTWIDHEYLNSYWSDGLIISTPTGSTGYSLSCGGPVIHPMAKNMVITPIAPHNLNARPLVIPDNKVISLKVSGREESYLISLDSRIATLQNDTEITIQKAPFTIKMVHLNEDSFIKTLREKLLWGEDKRN
jgi:NAD+ kinase